MSLSVSSIVQCCFITTANKTTTNTHRGSFSCSFVRQNKAQTVTDSLSDNLAARLSYSGNETNLTTHALYYLI